MPYHRLQRLPHCSWVPRKLRLSQCWHPCLSTYLQFHGDETPEFCEQWSVPYIRALRAEPSVDLTAEASRYPHARAFLVDAVHNGQFGGTRRTI